jgi:hypothetical protein
MVGFIDIVIIQIKFYQRTQLITRFNNTISLIGVNCVVAKEVQASAHHPPCGQTPLKLDKAISGMVTRRA